MYLEKKFAPVSFEQTLAGTYLNLLTAFIPCKKNKQWEFNFTPYGKTQWDIKRFLDFNKWKGL